MVFIDILQKSWVDHFLFVNDANYVYNVLIKSQLFTTVFIIKFKIEQNNCIISYYFKVNVGIKYNTIK